MINFDDTKKCLEKDTPNPRKGAGSCHFSAVFDPQNAEPVILTIALPWGNDYKAPFTWNEWKVLTAYMEWQHSQQSLAKN